MAGSAQQNHRTANLLSAAADQIGEIVATQPGELQNLLNKVAKFLRSKNWHTRIAAGQAVEAMIERIKLWDPPYHEDKELKYCVPQVMRLDQVDVGYLLQSEVLLASSKEAFVQPLKQENLKAESISAAKQLGIGFPSGLGTLLEDNHDFLQTIEHDLADTQAHNLQQQQQQQQQQHVPPQGSTETDNGQPPAKKARSQSEPPDLQDSRLIVVEDFYWPFSDFCDWLCRDLIDCKWECRHGAVTALRSVIRAHGRCAGIHAFIPVHMRADLNNSWLESLAVLIISVLIRDRFADFVGDEVVAPVRATCCQVLGLIVELLPLKKVKDVCTILANMAAVDTWEVQYSSLLAIKSALSARSSDAQEILSLVMTPLLSRLNDDNDDVKGTAASALLPVSEFIAKTLPAEAYTIVRLLQLALETIDDISISVRSVMELMSTLIHKSKCCSDEDIVQLLPRLYPYLTHRMVPVRHACLRTILTLLDADSNLPDVDGSGEWYWRRPSLVVEQDSRKHWLESNALTLFCMTYYLVVFEREDALRQELLALWVQLIQQSGLSILTALVSDWLMHWMELAAFPSGVPADDCALVRHLIDASLLKLPSFAPSGPVVDYESSTFILGGVERYDLPLVKDRASITARINCAWCIAYALAALAKSWNGFPGSSVQVMITGVLEQMLVGQVATQRIVAGLVLALWAVHEQIPSQLFVLVESNLEVLLQQQTFYEETVPLFGLLQKDCRVYMDLLSSKGYKLGPLVAENSFTLEMASKLVTTVLSDAKTKLHWTDVEMKDLMSFQQNVIASMGKLKQEKTKLNSRVSACIAGALVLSKCKFDKLNPIVRPFMEVLKTEQCPSLQHLCASWLCSLLDSLRSRASSPAVKVLKNVCLLCGSSPYGVPTYQQLYSPMSQAGGRGGSVEGPTDTVCTWKEGILSLLASPTKTEAKALDDCNDSMKLTLIGFNFEQGSSMVEMRTQYLGIQSFFGQLTKFYGSSVFERFPELWTQLEAALSSIKDFSIPSEYDGSMAAPLQQLLSVLQVLQTLCFCLHSELSKKVLSLLPAVKELLGHKLTLVRHMAARCFASMVHVNLYETMDFIVKNIESMDALNIRFKQGFIETIYFLVDRFGSKILNFSVVFIMPVLGCMSSQESHIRLLASLCFAQLIPLAVLRLHMGKADESLYLTKKVQVSQSFIEQLLDISKLEDFPVPDCIHAVLRKYQQDGVNWLAFLNRYKLHGILCDDMGLGKTLQCLCILVSDHLSKKESDQKDSEFKPSIVICPPTLTGHWCYEVKKFCPDDSLQVLLYSGNPGERLRRQSMVHKCDLVVSSYEVVRNDISFFKSISWNYCILDEGHIIKNPKAKTAKATKEIQSNYRLILTGTPIQNNAVDLWSLFDFLMPGFLGTQRQFHDRFGKPILASRDAKASSKEQESGALALEALHKQVLPFMLRRMKDDVLQDLPPKIIQDYFCTFSPIQIKLYESISREMMSKEQEPVKNKSSHSQPHPHVFQSLHFLRKVCNHPKLMLDKEKFPKQWKLWEESKSPQDNIDDICHSAKLSALKQLLTDCGFQSGVEGEDAANESTVSQHRALIFCQLKSIIDIIEHDLLRKHMPGISFLRLDGSVPAKSRQSLVQRFNEDPSIDLLLLTTQVGGLGLNLTSADTVIFYEHDWNPTKDIQAMDRCHRIGQKKIVNVFRLITVGTLEEKIMNLQRFKTGMATTVLKQDNSSLASMGTSSLLDLFKFEGQEGQRQQKEKVSKQQEHGQYLHSVLSELSGLWEESDYLSEYGADVRMPK